MSSYVDLTGSSPEPDESPGKILNGFLPRKLKQGRVFEDNCGSGLRVKTEASPVSRIHGAVKDTVLHKTTPKASSTRVHPAEVYHKDLAVLDYSKDIGNGIRRQRSPQPGSFYTLPGQTEPHPSGLGAQPLVLHVQGSGMKEQVRNPAVEERLQTYHAFRAKEAARRITIEEVSETDSRSSRMKRGASTPPDDDMQKRQRLVPDSDRTSLNLAHKSSLMQAKRSESDETPNTSLLWNQAEDNILLRSRSTGVEWETIARMLPGRSTHTCRSRYKHLMSATTPVPSSRKPHFSLPQTDTRRHVTGIDASPTTTPTLTFVPWSAAEDKLLVELKSAGHNWDEIAYHFPTRSKAALQVRYSTKHRGREAVRANGSAWYREDDLLLLKLKNLDNLSWKQIPSYFPGRTAKAVENRYYQRLSGPSVVLSTGQKKESAASSAQRQSADFPVLSRALSSAELDDGPLPDRRKAQRTTSKPTADGFVSWAEAAQRMKLNRDVCSTTENSVIEPIQLKPGGQDRVFQNTVSKLLRDRAAGKRVGISDELKNHVFHEYKVKNYFDGTSGDVHCLVWHPDGTRFAAGSIAVSDLQSMQYNRPLNLLAGATSPDILLELQENHIDRPFIDDSNDPNTSHAMRESQDPRLFMSVSAICFDPAPRHNNMYTTGYDKKLHVYTVGDSISDTKHRYEIHHAANIDLLDVNAQGLVATGCTELEESCVNVFQCSAQSWQQIAWLAPRKLSRSSLLPRALKWGTSHHLQDYLLAGFAGQSDDGDEQHRLAGDIGLWSVQTDGTVSRFSVKSVTQNVFDVAWNPTLTSASTMFVVACAHKANNITHRTRTAMQCYAPTQLTQPAMTFQCPASDINDVLYCPHDNNLVAAGATDGRVYVWDLRYASRDRMPLHTLAHQESLNVLPHDQDREAADTGVRFLSWGATSSRLYSGSSDGIVKVWNPYRSSDTALVDNVANFGSAIMSGSFSPDYCDLLIGEEKGRLNLLSIGRGDEEGGLSASAFKLCRAAKESNFEEPYYGAAQDLIDSGAIEYKPMGALPIRQAVQGPYYDGPFFKPTVHEWQRATNALKHATGVWERLKLAHDRAQLGEDEDDDVNALDKASARVEDAENRIQILQRRKDEYAQHNAQARKTQQAFLASEATSQSTSGCPLDCNYLPSHTESGREDSNRSAQRIPHALRAMRALPCSADASAPEGSSGSSPALFVSIANMACSELHRLGLAPACPECTRAATTKNTKLKAHLERMCKARLQRLKSSFDQSCVDCGAPVIPSTDGRAVIVRRCERCNFACPRCSCTARVSAKSSVVECESCGLSFKAGVLGYELYDEFTKKLPRVASRLVATSGRGTASDEDDDDDLGCAEREHYASLWGGS